MSKPKSNPAAAAPSPWVVRFAGQVAPGGGVLDVAAGRGRHAGLFLDRGHPVFAVDVAVDGLAGLIGRPGLTIVPADLEQGAWPFPGQRFAAVVVVNYLWRPLLPTLVAAVAPGGWLLYETFAQGNERFGRPANPAFLLAPGELLAAVEGLLEVRAYEHGEESRPTPAVRQRIAAWLPPA